MKYTWLVALAILFAVANGETEMPEPEGEDTLAEIELKADEPLQTDASYKELWIYESNGTIGVNTFSQVPQVLLSIADSDFSSVEDGSLCTPPNLETLILSHIENFPVLTRSMLGNCEKLKEFEIENVEMTPDALKNLVNLERVSIGGQNISHFTKKYLKPLKNLKELIISKCSIERIEPASICLSTKLRSIEFKENNVTTPLAKGVFENCDSIEDLSYRSDSQVEDGAFIGLRNLKRVRFSFLNFETLTKDFLLGFSSVKELVIYRSRIVDIAADTFDGFNNLKTLQLIAGQLKDIDSEVFSRIPNLVHLDISRNSLTTIDNISNPQLKKLDAHENNISYISTELLKQNLPRLKVLLIFDNLVADENIYDNIKRELNGIEIV